MIRPSDLQVTLGWAGVIGFGGALTSIGFRYVTSELHKLMTGSTAPGLVESFIALSWWHRLMIPAVGGLLAGLVLYLGMRWRGGVTTADYMEAVVLGDGKISTRRSIVKCLSAMFTIASGGSIGREGPLVQLSVARGFDRGAVAPLVDAAVAFARRLRGGGGNRVGL